MQLQPPRFSGLVSIPLPHHSFASLGAEDGSVFIRVYLWFNFPDNPNPKEFGYRTRRDAVSPVSAAGIHETCGKRLWVSNTFICVHLRDLRIRQFNNSSADYADFRRLKTSTRVETKGRLNSAGTSNQRITATDPPGRILTNAATAASLLWARIHSFASLGVEDGSVFICGPTFRTIQILRNSATGAVASLRAFGSHCSRNSACPNSFAYVY